MRWAFLPYAVSGVPKISHQLASALVLTLVLAASAAKDTGYVFVSHEKTNNIAVIDPKQDYKIIQWIPTCHTPSAKRQSTAKS
jgi:DNA-binding beta-propeller fold protein YncE